jgi:hypothetical protein
MRWADDEFRSGNVRVETLLHEALADVGRIPDHDAPPPTRRRARAPAAEGPVHRTAGSRRGPAVEV